MLGFSPEQERVRARLVAAGLPAHSRHMKPLVRAVVTRLGGSVAGKVPEEIDAAVQLVRDRAPAAFDPDQPADLGAGGRDEFARRYPDAAPERTEAEEASRAHAAEVAGQVHRLLLDLGCA